MTTFQEAKMNLKNEMVSLWDTYKMDHGAGFEDLDEMIEEFTYFHGIFEGCGEYYKNVLNSDNILEKQRYIIKTMYNSCHDINLLNKLTTDNGVEELFIYCVMDEINFN